MDSKTISYIEDGSNDSLDDSRQYLSNDKLDDIRRDSRRHLDHIRHCNYTNNHNANALHA